MVRVIQTLDLGYRGARMSQMRYQHACETKARKKYIKEKQKGAKGTNLQGHLSIHKKKKKNQFFKVWFSLVIKLV